MAHEDDDYYRKWVLERRAASLRRREFIRRTEEELKHEVWSCKIGDILEATRSFATQRAVGDGFTDVRIGHLEAGSRYKAVDLKGRGWDLELVSGNGPQYLRMMNWNILDDFKIVPEDKPGQE